MSVDCNSKRSTTVNSKALQIKRKKLEKEVTVAI